MGSNPDIVQLPVQDGGIETDHQQEQFHAAHFQRAGYALLALVIS